MVVDMPAGQHSSIRVALAVPPKLHEQLKAWADYEGRPVASLCMYLIENSLRAAQRDGIAPSFGNEMSTEERMGKWEGYRHASLASSSATTAPDNELTGVSSSANHSENKRFTQFMEDVLASQKLTPTKIAASKFKGERKEETKAEKLLALLQELTND